MRYICIKDYYYNNNPIKIFSIGQIISEIKEGPNKILDFNRINGNGTKYAGPDLKGYDTWIEVRINVGSYSWAPLTENEFEEHFTALSLWRDKQIDEILND